MPSEFFCLKRGKRVDFTVAKFDPALSLEEGEVLRDELLEHGHVISPQYELERRGENVVRTGLAGFALYTYTTPRDERYQSTDQLLDLLAQKGLEPVVPPAIFGTQVAG
jgi:hypothetical protein